MEKRIGIVGAGISGLLACKHVMDKGFEPIVFEAKSCIGGVWSQTIKSTKLQSPKPYYQFSDFPWPSSVKDTFPDHDCVLEYINAYASHFHILPRIRFNTRVTTIDYVNDGVEDDSLDLWGGTGHPFSLSGKWNVTVQDSRDPFASFEVYELDFVILCIGKHSDLPNIPDFPMNEGPEVFHGKVLHSMEYAAMGDDSAAQLTRDKCVAVVGYQKSAIDIANEIGNRNGAKYPCTLLFRAAYWTVPEFFLAFIFKTLNRGTEFLVHKPDEGFFNWFLAMFFSPLFWVFSKAVETYLKLLCPLKKYQTVPTHGLFHEILACMTTVLPVNFYRKVKQGSLILTKFDSFSFSRNGLIIYGNEESRIEADIVIFATGFKGYQKLANVFRSKYFQECILGSSAPFYRECIHPRIPQLAILGYTESPAILYTTEMRSKWLSHFLAGKVTLPSVSSMESETNKWEKYGRRHAKVSYNRSCTGVMLQIHCNDQLCKEMGYNPKRKSWFLPELLAPYTPIDYNAIH